MSDTKPIDLLVVDDNDEFRETMTKWFTRRGIHVQPAPTAEDALQSAQQRAFDVAVFDMIMPGMNGIKLLETFKQSHPECEVVLLTGQGTIETAVQAMKLGAFDFVTKPVELDVIRHQVRKATIIKAALVIQTRYT